MKKLLLCVFLMLGGAWRDPAKHPDCVGADLWPAAMAYATLKNDGLLEPETVDFDKTDCVRIASQQVGRDLFHQVHLVTFTKKDGQVIQAITVNDASNEECSMSGVEVFVVSKKLGGL